MGITQSREIKWPILFCFFFLSTKYRKRRGAKGETIFLSSEKRIFFPPLFTFPVSKSRASVKSADWLSWQRKLFALFLTLLLSHRSVPWFLIIIIIFSFSSKKKRGNGKEKRKTCVLFLFFFFWYWFDKQPGFRTKNSRQK